MGLLGNRRRSRYGNAMSRMHFRQIAENLGAISDPDRRRVETDRWIPLLKKQNPRFNETRFRAAVEAAASHGGFNKPIRDSRTGRFVRARRHANRDRRSERAFRGGKHYTRAFERAYEGRPSHMEEASRRELHPGWRKARRKKLKARRNARTGRFTRGR